ncbi:ABC transporter C family member 3-like isoform X1 [Nymphaea colorata]|nr:ABC transporter C family member 3-like isoform X1 [Nymphaea colorata]
MNTTMFSTLTHSFLIFGNTHVLNGDFLLFTPLFRHSISLGVHLFFLLLTLLWVFLRRSTLKSYKTSGFLYNLSLICSLGLCFLFGGLSTYHYLKYWDGSSVETTIAQVDWMEQAVAWGAISGFLRFGMSWQRFQILLRIWWLVFFVLSFYSFVIDVAFYKGSCFFWADLLCSFAALFLCCASLRGIFSTDDNERTHLREPLLNGSTEKKDVANNVTPYATAGFLSLLTFSWLSPLFPVGNSKALDLEDVPEVAKKDSAKFVYPAFRSKLDEGESTDYMGKLRLAKALFSFVWKDVAWAGFFCLLYSLSSFVGPYLIDSLVQYINGRQRFAHEGYVLVSVFLVAKLVQSFSQRHWYFLTRQIGIRNRAALNATIYKKGLSLSSQSRKMHTSGEIMNLMSVDADRIALFCWYVHDLWVVPLQIILALAILYRNLGLASLSALVAAFLIMLANLPLVKSQEGLQEKLMESKDERMKATSEILRNMRILKLQAWEMRFLSKVMDLRNTETNWLRKYIYTTAFVSFLFWGAPIFISAAAFGSCMLLGIPLMSGKVLSALATIEILQQAIYNLPDTVSMIAQIKVSLDRIASFLRLEEMKTDAVEKLSKDVSTLAVEIYDGVFSWDPSSSVPTLQNLNFKVQHGMKVAVCGTVGSGKTSLLSCILGEVERISGTVRLSGTTAFVAQSPWIQSGKIEENILFGKEMDRDRYERVIDACDLRKDIELLPFGDQTTIGERGINLSGGQKQRVQIARALYQDADVYLFDDPFSAVDAHTGSHLFKECLHGFLGSKTVIYVTHQVEFLPTADLVLVMRDGQITQSGPYDKILGSGTDFMELVGAHEHALSAIEAATALDSQGLDVNELNRSFEIEMHGHEKDRDGESNGNGVELEQPTEKNYQLVQEEEREKGRVGFSVYWEYITTSYGGALVPLILLSHIVYNLLQIGSNYWMAWATPVSDEHPSSVSGFTLIVVYIILSLASAVCELFTVLLIGTVGFKTATVLFNKLHACIFHAPMSFLDSTPTGRILSRISSDQSELDLYIPELLATCVFAGIQLLGSIAVISQISWQVLIIFIPVACVGIWLQQYYLPTSRELSRLVGLYKAPMLQHFAESIAGSSTIRSFNEESRFLNRNFQLIDGFSRPKFHISAAMEWLCLRLDVLSSLIFAFSLIFLISLPKDAIYPGIAGLAVTYGLNLNMLQMYLVWCLCNAENRMISVERILQYTRLPSEPPLTIETNRPSKKWPSHGEIDISELQVRYAPHLPLVLKGFTCTFHGGAKTGIVGRTGSGKSTLVQALFRIIDPSYGRIVIDGIDISTIGLHDLRSRLSIIPQEPTMFQGTVRTNLDPLEEYADEQIWEALDKCQLGDVVRQKDGKLDAAVTENGENWSVGQRQLVCLGRVLLKKSRILVLDEATASVDTATDGLIQQTLRQHFSDCSILTIAHRMASVLDSDMVLVMENGLVAEYDSPRKLLQDTSSAFAKLVNEYVMRSSSTRS